MAKGFKGPGMGRPKIEWDDKKEALFQTLMGIPFVTEEAICDVLGISISTLSRRISEKHGVTFEELKAQKHAGMKMKLAGKQYEAAMKGNNVMLVWLGKQWLGQTDKIEQKQNVNVTNLTDVELDKMIKELEDGKTTK